ncbi:putative stage III sporulation protein E [Methylocaldum marinum]|uniref:Putative stage III sporulation protein E n=1 Tax=Methylocaldum marinum TaxID=1432792 RepID=A0A250KX66_9GAMM|nr:putative stage III sporulation protein E [Methylocaldum marinum]
MPDTFNTILAIAYTRSVKAVIFDTDSRARKLCDLVYGKSSEPKAGGLRQSFKSVDAGLEEDPELDAMSGYPRIICRGV